MQVTKSAGNGCIIRAMCASSAEWRTLGRVLGRPPWRTLVPIGVVALILVVAYALWSPGREFSDGRHDRGTNAIWIGHGWLGVDEWFERQGRDDEVQLFREPERITELAARLRRHHITDVYPHLCPCRSIGELPLVDEEQARRFVDGMDGIRVIPWIGGVNGRDCRPESVEWRKRFVAEVCRLLEAQPGLAGIQLNIEPWPSGDVDLLALLEEMRTALPQDKLLGVAAYPPPTIWHRHPEVHWDEAYFREVARRCDQMAVMMYDTALRSSKFYRKLMADWTREVLSWSGETPVLLGVPTYDDAGTGYHRPEVENLGNALAGIHAGLAEMEEGGEMSKDLLPANYRGVAIYCEWETEEGEWGEFRERFLRRR